MKRRLATRLLPLSAALAAPLAAQVPAEDGASGAAQGAGGYEAAVAARLAGDAQRARALLDAWIAQHPADSDALVQRGYAQLALGNPVLAADDFRAALALAPGYADAEAGLAIAAARRAPPGGARLLAGGAISRLGAGREDWREASLGGEVHLTPGLALGGQASWLRRFGVSDTEFEARAAIHPNDRLWLRASIGGTPAADFRPELALAAGADLRLSRGTDATVLSLDASWQRFPLQQVVSLTPGITQYFGRGRWWASLRGLGIVPQGGGLELGALARLDFAPREGRRLFVGAGNGPDTDIGLVTRVTSVFAGAELPLSGRWSLLPSVAREWQQAGPDRTEARLEIKAAF